MYRIKLTASSLRHLDRLPEKVRDAVLELIRGVLADEPRRVGKPLGGDLAGLWSARRAEYRVVYEIDEEARIVIVHRVQHRRDVYHPR